MQETLDERQKREMEGGKNEGRRKKQEKAGGEEGFRFSTEIFQRVGKGEEDLATSAEPEMGVLSSPHISFRFSHWMSTDQNPSCPRHCCRQQRRCLAFWRPCLGMGVKRENQQ